jgi:plastocyanin
MQVPTAHPPVRADPSRTPQRSRGRSRGINSLFEPATITVASGDSVTLTLHNEDAGLDHNIEVSQLFSTPECNGPCSVTVTFVAPAPGEYQLFCIAHPDMVGTLKVN